MTSQKTLIHKTAAMQENDINQLKSIVDKAVPEPGISMAGQVHTPINTVIKQQSSLGRHNKGSQNFRESAGQVMLDIGKAIARYGNRNG